MEKDHTFTQSKQESFNNALEEVLREGARKLLERNVELEVAEYIERDAEERDENGHRSGYTQWTSSREEPSNGHGAY